jgi:putative flippase GtrA
MGASPYFARLLSFAVAVTATWLLNRHWTFRDRKSPARGVEYMRYLTVQTSGALINLSVYSACLFFSEWMLSNPVAALAVGSGVAMVYNYLGAHHFAFRGPKESR